MESQVSEILENVLGLLGLEGSFEVIENEEEVRVEIETVDPGRLIGFRGETLDALQLIINQIVARKMEQYKRVVIDVAGWRKNKENDLVGRAKTWAQEVLNSGQEKELEPMPAWQRRIIHLTVSEIKGVESESLGEGPERHLIIRTAVKKSSKKTGKAKKVLAKE